MLVPERLLYTTHSSATLCGNHKNDKFLMISPEVAQAQGQLAALKKEQKDLTDLKLIQIGHTKPGSRPDLLARAVRDFIPLPIKYTQSIESLRSLYKYSLDSKDTKLYFWTCRQIEHLYSKPILMAIESEIPKTVPRPTPDVTFLDILRENHSKMSPYGIKKFVADATRKGEIPPFFAKQLERYADMNELGQKLIKNENPEEHKTYSTSEILRASFLSQDNYKKSDPLYPANICNNFKIEPIVSVPSLIEAQGPRVGFHEIITNEVFTKKKMFKTKLSISQDIIFTKLAPYRPDESFLKRIEDIGD